MPIDINSFVFGPSGGSWGSDKNYGVSSWASPGGWNYATTTPTGTTRQPMQASKAATSFNLSSVGDIGKLSETLNSINQASQRSALASRIPNNPALETQSSANIMAGLKGQLPQDVVNQLGQSAAERGVGRGLGAASQNTNAAYLRALGLTSLDRMREAQGELSAADARNPIAPIVDASRYTLTPAESAQLNLGYLTEADRNAQENARLAIEGSRYRGGGGGGGGYGGPGFVPDNNPFSYAEPGIGPIGRAQFTPGVTGGDVLSNDFSQADWLASLGNYQYSTPADVATYGEGGTSFSPGGSDYQSVFPDTYGPPNPNIPDYYGG